MATKTEVCNQALGRIGSATINSIDEHSPEAQQCKRFFDITRQSLLRDWHFNFANAFQTLTQIDGGASFNMGFAYQLPSDYLQALSFNGVGAGIKQTYWKIANGRLYTDMGVVENAKLDYIRDVTDVTEWDSEFVTAFAWYLAAAIAPSLEESPDAAIRLLQAGQAFLQNAKGADTHETGLRVMRGLPHSKYQQARAGFGINGLPRWMYQNYNVSHQ